MERYKCLRYGFCSWADFTLLWGWNNILQSPTSSNTQPSFSYTSWATAYIYIAVPGVRGRTDNRLLHGAVKSSKKVGLELGRLGWMRECVVENVVPRLWNLLNIQVMEPEYHTVSTGKQGKVSWVEERHDELWRWLNHMNLPIFASQKAFSISTFKRLNLVQETKWREKN